MSALSLGVLGQRLDVSNCISPHFTNFILCLACAGHGILDVPDSALKSHPPPRLHLRPRSHVEKQGHFIPLPLLSSDSIACPTLILRLGGLVA